MTTFLWLLLLSVIMAITSLAVGLFPLKARVALHHMNLASALSMGILVGTALAAVIPEGVQMLLDSGYSNNPDSGMALSGVIGLSLIVGFAVMFLVDHYEQLITTGEVSNTLPEQDSIWKSFLRSPLTLGLLLHSFVDGIALGTAFVNNDDSFQILFLLMITIHKLPTAFSLSVMLHQEGLLDSVVQIHLLVFSVMTPVSSILTYLFVLLLKLNNNFVVGVLFLFSAGTFLYSVIHVMMEVMNKKDDYSLVAVSDPLVAATAHQHGSTFSRSEVLLSMIGIFIPVIFTFAGDH